MELRIDPEFRDKIPPLTDDEFKQLEENILSDNEVYEPICVWNGTIVDGHNRWKIIQVHPSIPYRIKEMTFVDKWEAFEWMYKKQLGRRNLTDEQRTYLLGKLYEARKKCCGAPSGNKNAEKQRMQNEFFESNGRTMRTYDVIAKEQGVNASTVQRAEHFSQGIDSGEEVSSGFKQKVLSGEIKTTKKNISELRKLEPEERKEKVQRIIEGRKDDAEKKNMTPPKGYKKQMEFLHEADKIARDAESSVEFTGDMLVEMVRNNTDGWASSLKNMLITRSTFLVGNTRRKVEKEIECFITKINNIKELLK